MNILPKKRWHVRTKANIERVRRDEAQAALEEKDRQRRILFAEQEARTEELRRRNGYKSRASTTTDVAPKTEDKLQDQHVNLFEEGADQVPEGPNSERQAEKKAEQEKWEKSVGILTYLGQGSTETNAAKPWYLQDHSERVGDSSEKVNSRSEKRKMLADPLLDMQRHLKEKYGTKSAKEMPRPPVKPSTVSGSKKSLETLRLERLKREKAERDRARHLLGTGDTAKTTTKEFPLEERQRRYNSQFNPHIARQNIPTSDRN